MPLKSGFEKTPVAIYKKSEEIKAVQKQLRVMRYRQASALSGNYNFSNLNSHREFSNNTRIDRAWRFSKTLAHR